MTSAITIVFLTQQCAEKSIKGFLAYNKIKFTKTHDLEILGLEVLKLCPDLNDLLRETKNLNPYAVEFRYPDAAIKSLEIQDIEEALVIATQVYQEMTSRIPFDSSLVQI